MSPSIKAFGATVALGAVQVAAFNSRIFSMSMLLFSILISGILLGFMMLRLAGSFIPVKIMKTVNPQWRWVGAATTIMGVPAACFVWEGVGAFYQGGGATSWNWFNLESLAPLLLAPLITAGLMRRSCKPRGII